MSKLVTRKPIREIHYERFMNYLKNDYSGYRYVAETYERIATLLFFFGLRLNETQSIKKEHIKNMFEYGELKVRTPKQDKKDKDGNIIKKAYRYIPVSEEAKNSIMRLYSHREEDDIFWCGKGKKRTSNYNNINLINEFNKHLKKALGIAYTSHSFREGLIYEMVNDGVKPKVVMIFFGHSDISITMRYYNPTKEDIKSSLVR